MTMTLQLNTNIFYLELHIINKKYMAEYNKEHTGLVLEYAYNCLVGDDNVVSAQGRLILKDKNVPYIKEEFACLLYYADNRICREKREKDDPKACISFYGWDQLPEDYKSKWYFKTDSLEW